MQYRYFFECDFVRFHQYGLGAFVPYIFNVGPAVGAVGFDEWDETRVGGDGKDGIPRYESKKDGEKEVRGGAVMDDGALLGRLYNL